MPVAVAGAGVRGVVTFSGVARNPWGAAASWESVVRVAVPSTSGRGVSWRVEHSGQRSGRWEVRASAWNIDGTARDRLFVEDDVVDIVTSNALQVHDVEINKVGAADDQDLLAEYEGFLTKKSRELAQLDDGTTIFLVGMMASGKSTVGRILADALGYKFFDSDEVIESFAGGLPVKEIFRQKSEAAFRDLETRALRELSGANSLVVATGGGAVLRDENWEYLLDGITVWLDVPVEDLARRVTTVGTESRPLLGGECNFDKAFLKLSTIMAAREHHYARAHCRLSLRDLATRLHLTGVGALTPAAIAVLVLEEITKVLQEGKYIRPPVGY